MTRLLALVWPSLRAEPAALDAAQLESMLDALDDLSPRVEAVDVGVALVDVTGLEAMVGPERRIAARAVMLARTVAPLSVRCGIGDNRWLASLAARLSRPERIGAPAALHVLPAGAAGRDALRDLPVTLLPADRATRERLALFGLTTMGQLADLPRAAMGAQFGAVGERLQQLARGLDPRPIVPRRRPERLTATRQFEVPLESVGAIALILRATTAELCETLSHRGLAPGRATLAVQLENAPALRLELAFPEPAREPDWITRLLIGRLEAAARARSASHSYQDRLSHGSGPGSGRVSRTSTPSTGLHRVKPTVVGSWQERGASEPRHRAKPMVVGTWQNLEPEEPPEREEPRIEAFTLTLDRLADPRGRQLPAFEPQAGRWEELRWSLERLAARFGEGKLWRAELARPRAARDEERATLVDIGP